MSRATSVAFVSEIPLRVTQRQEATILVRFGIARQLYNACLGESLRRLNLMRQSKTYQSACYIPKDEEHKKERSEAFGEARKQYAFSDAYAKKVGEKLGWMRSTIQQTVASRAFGTVSRYAFGKGGKPRFKNEGQFDSVEGKQNTVISWDGKSVVWGELVLPAIFPKAGLQEQRCDSARVERQA
jgi:putative transposase